MSLLAPRLALPPLALRHVTPRFTEWELLPSGAKKKDSWQARLRLTLSRHVIFVFSGAQKMVNSGYASGVVSLLAPRLALPPLALRHVTPRFTEWELLPSGAKKKDSWQARLRLTLSRHVIFVFSGTKI